MSWFGWGGSKKEGEGDEDLEYEEGEDEEPLPSVKIQTEAPLVKDLMEKHRDMVDKLRDQCKDVLQEEHDDLFLLRYILSRKTLDKAEPAVRKGLEWRKANKSWLDEAKKPDGKAPYADLVERYTAVDLHKRNNDGGAVMIIRAGMTPAKELMEAVTVEQLTDWFMFRKEQTFLICDEATRRTGKLVKTVVLNDATGVPGMWELMGLLRNNGLMTALGDSSKLSESVYPQLVAVSVIINPPGFVKMVFKLVKVFMSASMMEKVKLCGGDIANGDIHDCPMASKFLKIENIPTFLGGEDDDFSAILDPERRDALHGVSTPVKEEGDEPKSSSKKKKKKGKKDKK